MRTSLDRIISASFGAYFLGVLVIGATSVWLTEVMLKDTVAVAQESRSVDFINKLQVKTVSLMRALHERLERHDAPTAGQALKLADEIEGDVDDYLKRHAVAADAGMLEAQALMRRVRDGLHSLRKVSDQAGADEEERLSLLDQHASVIESHVRRVNQLHFEFIARDVERVRRGTQLIRTLYVMFGLLGLAVAYTGYRMHSRHVVRPVKELQLTAARVAAGDFGVRVHSRSQTEIGELYRAFNRMVEQLQENDRQRAGFHQLLEQKVDERTRELEQTHRSLQAAQGELMRMEKMAMLGQIATSVNHEVRTPLNALYMNVQLIRRALERSSAGVATERRTQQRDVLDRIAMVDREVTRISDMLEEFVHYARLPPPQLEALDPNPLVGHVAEMLRERAAQARVRLGVTLAEAAPTVRADANKLIQVLVNLCTNAIQAMPDGGTLDLTTTVEGDWFKITVADTGTGIAQESLDKIFQPFFTTKEHGLGFGLAIVQRIVEHHGGQIACQSEPGAGTVFTIRLPVAPAA